MVTTISDWSISAIDIPDYWSSNSGRLIITGDAAHAMVPYMALGAAMAVEDAAGLAAALKMLRSKYDLPKAIALWKNARSARVAKVHEASFANGLILHLPDGSVQEARDQSMRQEVVGESITETVSQWADPVLTQWAYGHDVVKEIEALVEQELSRR